VELARAAIPALAEGILVTWRWDPSILHIHWLFLWRLLQCSLRWYVPKRTSPLHCLEVGGFPRCRDATRTHTRQGFDQFPDDGSASCVL